MPWLRAGDNAATHPIVMRVGALVRSLTARVLERDVAVNEVFGFALRCALQSAGHVTDYVIDEGTAHMIGGPRTDRLVDLACQAGYMHRRRRRGGETELLLVENPEFVHLRKRAEIEWDRQQRADAANPALVVPVRLRDGDACRYCGQVVNWRDKRGGRGATYDHRPAGAPATAETLFVACRSCNSGRRDRPDADDRYPLLPAPADPFYSELTAALLASHGHTVTATTSADLRPGNQPGNATTRRTPSQGGATLRPASQAGNAPAAARPPGGERAPTAARSADSANRLGDGLDSAGSGRDGTGSSSKSNSGSSARARDAPGRSGRRSRRRKPPAQRDGSE